MPSSPYSYFRPLLAPDRRWAAIDWQRGTADAITDEQLAAGLSEIRSAGLAKRWPVVVPGSLACLEDAAPIDVREAAAMVFVLPQASLDQAPTLARCAELRRQGRHFAVRLDDAARLRDVPSDAFDHLWIAAEIARQEFSGSDLAYAEDRGWRLIANQVNTHEMFSWLSSRGFSWHGSHFLSTPNPLNAREPDLTRLKLLKLLTLVEQDGDTHALEEIFREEAKLSYHLLRLVNSVALAGNHKISNFAQAITIIGRRPLQRWLQLLVYADHLADGDAPNPLMLLAALRGRQMELLSAALAPSAEISELSDNAFLVGLFSLLEVLVNLPMSEIVKELPMHEAAANALLRRRQGGVLGRLLACVMASESGEFANAEALLREQGIDAATHTRAQLAALNWVANINIGKDPDGEQGARLTAANQLAKKPS